LFEFKKLLDNDLLQLLNRIIEKENLVIESDTKSLIIDLSNGDARGMLNLLEISTNISKNITMEIIKNIKSIKTKDNSIDSKYNLISALIKSIRGNDIDASIYYLARLIDIQETPDYIARRLVILSSEDIGNANPNALNIAVNTLTAVKEIGYPEARIILSQCVVYLASSPKSNSSYLAINKALNYIENTNNIPKVPEYLKSNTKTYQNPHFTNTNQKYLEQDLKFYNSNNVGYEKTLNEWNKKV
jgi:putative ATPase